MVVTVLFFLFFQSLNESTRKEALKANDFLASHVITYIDNALRTVDYSVLSDVLTNEAVKDYLHQKGDAFTTIQAVEAIEQLKSDYPQVHSAYLVRFEDNTVLLNGKAVALANFSDKAYINKGSAFQGWSQAREFQAYADQTKKTVTTLVRETSDRSGMYVVNVSLEALHRTLGGMYDADITTVRILDQKQQPLKEMQKAHSRAASESPVFASYTSGYTGWTIETSLKEGKLVGFAFFLHSIWGILAVIISILGIGWMIYMGYRNYKPIRQIMGIIQASSQDTSQALSGNEFNVIQTTIEKMIAEEKKGLLAQQQHRSLQQKHVFRELLEGRAQRTEVDWQQAVQDVGIEHGEAFVVAVVEVDAYNKFTANNKSEDQSLKKFILKNALHYQAQEANSTVWVEWLEEKRLFVVLWGDEIEIRSIKKWISAYRLWVEEHVETTVSIGLGDVKTAWKDVVTSARSAITALEYKAVKGSNQLLVHNECHSPSSNDVYPMLRDVSRMVRDFGELNTAWEAAWKQWFEKMKQCGLMRSDIVQLFDYMLQYADQNITHWKGSSAWRKTYQALRLLSHRFETIEELEAEGRTILHELHDALKNDNNEQQQLNVVLCMKRYIETHYANPDISLAMLSDVFQMNSKYVSQRFKEGTGEKFLDFLTRLRMDEAKRLMLTTNETIQDISSKVGYVNYISFNRAFKKAMGKSPSDFRKQCSSQALSANPHTVL